jgi:hypothetical protein
MVHGSVGETAMVREETVGSACDVRPCRPVSGEGRGAVSRTEHGGAAGGTPGPTRPLREVRPCGDARGAWASLSTWARASGHRHGQGRRRVLRARRSLLWPASHFTERSTRQDCVLRARVCVPSSVSTVGAWLRSAVQGNQARTEG